MRRKEREMNREFGLKIIDAARYGIISMVDKDGKPYGLPLSIVRDGEVLYFHSAKEGKKVEALEQNTEVSVAFVGETRIPENYTREELDDMVRDEANAKLFISNVFTTEFESAIIFGKVKLVEDEDERIKAMRLICEKYTPTKMDYFDMAVRTGLGRANVYRIEIEQLTAKRKKYDEYGEEMRFGRV